MSRPCHAKRKLRFAIMCRGTRFPAWQARCIQHLLKSGIATPVSLIVDREPPAGRSGTAAPFRGVLFRLYERFWVHRRIQALSETDLAPDLADVPSHLCAAPPDRHGRRAFSNEDVASVQCDDLDFILQFAFEDVGGKILGAARYGLWTYRPDARQTPELTAFWEFYRGEQAHRAALYRAAEPPGSAPVILQQGSFKRQRSLAQTITATLFGGVDWATRAARQIALGQPLDGESAPVPPSRTSGRTPTDWEFLLFLARRAASLAQGIFRHFFLLEYWNVGIADQPVEAIAAGGRPGVVRWLAPPSPGRYHADPFALPEKPEAILVEEYDQLLGKGWISWIATSGNAPPQRIAAFDGGVHYSYPFVFSADGAIYCIPECAEKRRVDLYRAVRFPDHWQLEATLIEDFPALDSTVLQHDGRWWLFSTSSDEGSEHKLHVWYADHLLGPWRSHALNPVKCDVSSSRPAGRLFMMAGMLHRPGQDCSRTYGGAVTVNRITRLTPTEFAEIPIGRIVPAEDGRYRAGLHTICPLGDRTIIDGKHFRFDVRAPYLRIRQMLGRLGGHKRPELVGARPQVEGIDHR